MTTIAAVFIDELLAEPNQIDANILMIGSQRAAKKAFKREPDLSLIIFGLREDNYDDVYSLINYVRNGLNNSRTRICVISKEHNTQRLSELLNHAYADQVVVDTPETRGYLPAILESELRSFRTALQNESRRETEIQILTALGKMSRANFSDEDCVENLRQLLHGATRAHTSRIFFSNGGDEPDASTYRHCSGKNVDLGSGPWLVVQAALKQRCQQLCIDRDAEDHKRTTPVTAASIALPLLCYEQTIAVLHFLLPPDSLETITVEFVELLGKLAEQVRILFERRASEGELQTQFDRVKSALKKLETTQMELYQSEKMASVGQLAAGIAHEINNPITFLAGNMRPLEDYTDSMSSMLQLHQDFLNQIDDSTPKLWEVAEHQLKPKAEELDISFIIEDVRSLVSESKEGLKRVSDIVQNLTRFARKDSVEYVAASIETGLDDSIRMLRQQIDESISIQREYGHIPDVVCSHGLVNQVFLNLIKNAAQAIGSNGTITVRTEEVQAEDGSAAARISVLDTGAGIPEESRPRVFEPFYTTKAVGEGTGLGLSMCYDIIDRHSGNLSFTSEVGVGTEFVVQIPFAPRTDDKEGAGSAIAQAG